MSACLIVCLLTALAQAPRDDAESECLLSRTVWVRSSKEGDSGRGVHHPRNVGENPRNEADHSRNGVFDTALLRRAQTLTRAAKSGPHHCKKAECTHIEKDKQDRIRCQSRVNMSCNIIRAIFSSASRWVSGTID